MAMEIDLDLSEVQTRLTPEGGGGAFVSAGEGPKAQRSAAEVFRSPPRGTWAQNCLNLSHSVSAESLQEEWAGLTPKQAEVAALLSGGMSISRATQLAGVSRAQFYRWRQEHREFQAALQRGRCEMQAQVRTQLDLLMQEAVAAVSQAIRGGNARAAMQLLRGLGFLPGRLAEIGSDDPEELARRPAE